MPKPAKPSLLQIVPQPDKPALSKVQQQFNKLLQQIDKQKRLLRDWQDTIPVYELRVHENYDPLWDSYNDLRVDLVKLFDRAYHDPLFKKADKGKLRHLILDIAVELIGRHGRDELKDLHDRHSEQSFDANDQEQDRMVGEMMKGMARFMYDVDIGDDVEITSPEQFHALLQEKLKERQEQAEQREQAAEQRRAKRKKTEKQLAREAKQQQQEQSISQSLREVYRKLTTALHPDREADPVERERKTELMQRVNIAYGKKDLLGLLELQMQAEQIDQAHIANIAEDRLKHFNKILKGQSEELRLEIDDICQGFKIRLDLSPYVALTPAGLLSRLDADIRTMRQDIAQLKQDLQDFSNLKELKAWLKTYKIPQPDFSDDFSDDFFLDGFIPPGQRP